MLILSSILVSVSLSAGAVQAQTFDHEFVNYGALLRTHVEQGLVDYSALAENPAVLAKSMDEFAALSKDELAGFSSEQKLAFWINAYNLFTIAAIVDHYPVKSIKKIGGVWNKLKWNIAGDEFTLDNVEHDILRKEFNEPRIHVALVCASLSCPELYNEPFRATTVRQQLQLRSEAFARDTLRNVFDAEKQRLRVSKIFDWYGADFISLYSKNARFAQLSGKKLAVANFLYDHLTDEQRKTIDAGKLKISYLDYDWDLNDQAPED